MVRSLLCRALSIVLLVGSLGFSAMAARAEPFGFAALRQLIETRDVRTVEGLIEALPVALRTHYSLVFASRSLQGASFAAPRAILFGDDATLVVTFNGDSTERGHDAVETMEFDPLNHQFLFREIIFPTGGEGDKPRFSGPNPARCAACHGAPARPVWDSAPLWPGVYGERYRAGLSAIEAAGLKTFLAQQQSHPRYRALLGAENLSHRDTYVPTSRELYNGVMPEPPNARLSMLLATLNVRSIVSEIVRAPAARAHRYVLLAAAGGSCGPLAQFYPDAAALSMSHHYAAYEASADAPRLQQAANKGHRRASDRDARHGLAAPTEAAQLRFVSEQSLGVATRHWTLALEEGTRDLAAPESAGTLDQALFEWVAASDPDLRSMAAYRSFGADDGYCAYLRRESRKALEPWYEAHPVRPTPVAAPASGPLTAAEVSRTLAQPAMLERCAACHRGEVGPALPFADTDALALALHREGYRRGRLLDEILYRLAPEAGVDAMPRGINITARERTEMEAYFLALASQAPAPKLTD
jgi:hypothetical protein